MKESLSRLVVELAKQTWPQYWPTFLEDLDVLTHCGVRCVCLCVCEWGGGVYIPWETVEFVDGEWKHIDILATFSKCKYTGLYDSTEICRKQKEASNAIQMKKH